MSTTRLTITDGMDERHDLVINNRTDGLGPDIREDGDAIAQADRSVSIDVPHSHCSACQDNMAICDVLEITTAEANKLIRWRTAKADGVSSKEMGEVLDKVVKALAHGTIDCQTDYTRIVLRVESGDA